MGGRANLRERGGVDSERSSWRSWSYEFEGSLYCATNASMVGILLDGELKETRLYGLREKRVSKIKVEIRRRSIRVKLLRRIITPHLPGPRVSPKLYSPT